jgi:hypothetical protein
MESGRVIRQGTVADVTGRGESVRWELGPGPLDLEVLAAVVPGHQLRLDEGERRILVQSAPKDADLDASSVALAGALAAAGVGIRSVQRGRSLEESFLEAAG